MTIFALVSILVVATSLPGLHAKGDDSDTLAQAVAWLEKASHRIIRASRRTMTDGTAAFPPFPPPETKLPALRKPVATDPTRGIRPAAASSAGAFLDC